MSSSIPPRRKWATKVRGGCTTCKLRHVRCDGRRPRCTTCQRSFRQCGYSPEEAHPGQLKVVMWQPTRLALQRPSSNPGHTTDEARAVDYFQSKVAANLGGVFDSSFWSQHVLRVARHEPSVRHAIVALASLSETVLETVSSRDAETFAIRQQTKAIAVLNQNLQNNFESSPEVLLMTCVLFICFEMFHNRHESALGQMSSGLYVFYNWRSNHPYPEKHSELTTHLEHIFQRLTVQTFLFIETRPSQWRFLTSAFTPAMPAIPSVFRSIDEARDCLNSCQCFLYYTKLLSGIESLEQQDVGDSPASQLDCDLLQQWMLSFEGFTTSHRDRWLPREQRAAVLLEIHQITASALLFAGPYTQETIFDSLEPKFSQIIDLSSRLMLDGGDITQAGRPACPTFDMGILPPLYLVASRCRHPSIRRKALCLLRNGPSQEGIWHRDMLSNIAERIMHLEETDCADVRSSADIPAAARVTLLNARINSTQRIVTLHYCRPNVGELMEESRRMQVLQESVQY